MSLTNRINADAEKRPAINFGTNPKNILDLSIGQLAQLGYWIEVYVQISGQVAIDASKDNNRYGGRAETFELALADLNDVLRKTGAININTPMVALTL